MFQRKRGKKTAFDPETQQPAVRRSICTGEMTAGFIDKKTGHFTDLMRVDGQRGLAEFCREIGVAPEDVKTIY